MDLLEARDAATTDGILEDKAASQVRAAIEGIDWTFSDRPPAPAIEAIHPYPAKFIGDIPRALMNILSLPRGTLVFDPFAGSGTTLVEAQRRGWPSVGVDLNPIGCLIARVKTAKTPRSLLERSAQVVAAARSIRPSRTWDIPNIDHWFRKDVQRAVAALIQQIDELRKGAVRDSLRLALSSILVRVSNQDSDTRYAAVEKDVSREDVFSGFERAVDRLNNALLARQWPQLPSSTIIEADTLSLSPHQIPGRVGLVITSPPYPNAYEYWLYHKYRMWWLGHDPLIVREHEIGARAHFFRRNHHTSENFIEQMDRTFSLIERTMIKGGHACFVIGRSMIHGRLVDNADIITTVAAKRGFYLISRIARPISSNRKSFNLAHANIKTETVLVFRKIGR